MGEENRLGERSTKESLKLAKDAAKKYQKEWKRSAASSMLDRKQFGLIKVDRTTQNIVDLGHYDIKLKNWGIFQSELGRNAVLALKKTGRSAIPEAEQARIFNETVAVCSQRDKWPVMVDLPGYKGMKMVWK